VLVLTPKGLYCPAGQFHIDPKGAVDHAVITHAHSDHARRGAKKYYCVHSGTELLKMRVGQKINVESHEFGEPFTINGVKVSFHPAGHILGSSQVRIEHMDEVWVASGDYKRDPDPTCEPFESVPCDVFVTEATFGTPSYTWPKDGDVGKEIADWWRDNASKGVNSVLFAYSLGKAQRVLGLLRDHAPKPVICHPAVTETNRHYLDQGILLAETRCLSKIPPGARLRGELLLVPQAFLNSPQAKILGGHYQTAFASGWMAKREMGFDKGFVLSDHADWNDLVKTILETKARRVYVQHRGSGALVRHLRTLGIKAFPEEALTSEPSDQMFLF
jgi:putative mRNA 3-end processing factor